MNEYDSIKNYMLENRFDLWRTALRDMERISDPEHTVVRFLSSTTYLFSTGGCYWAMDPVYAVRSACPEEEFEKILEMMKQFSFIIITHTHGDHFNVPLVQRLYHEAGIQFVISADSSHIFFTTTELPPEAAIVLDEGESTTLHGITIRCFAGYHNEPGGNSYPGGSYLVTLPDGINLFFPVDVRDYDSKMPPDLPAIDFLFGHVWLGRLQALKDDYPLLEPLCRFMLRSKPTNIFLGHLREISRNPDSMWTPRHARMITEKISAMSPQVHVSAPEPGEAYTLTSPFRRDLFTGWSKDEQELFRQNLGIAIKFKNWQTLLEKAVEARVPVLEISATLPPADEMEVLKSGIKRWRERGGAILSVHLPEIDLQDKNHKDYLTAGQKLRELGINRVTQHVPLCSVAEYNSDPERIADVYVELLDHFLTAGVAVGIENVRIRANETTGEERRFGCTPDECIEFVQKLRRKTGSELIGLHLDIGHAAYNNKFTFEYPPAFWFAAAGNLINGLHVHQCTEFMTPQNLFPGGHQHVSGRSCGYPGLYPLYSSWEAKMFRAPIFLEISRGPEGDAFKSLERLLRSP